MFDLVKARGLLLEGLSKESETSSRLWENTIKLIITLASSFLVLTLALTQHLFPNIKNTGEVPLFLLGAWTLLFFSIIFGIITKINEVIFHANIAKKQEDVLKECDKKLTEGKTIDTLDVPESYMTYNDIRWGVICINGFILAILCLCLSLLEKLVSTTVCVLAFFITIPLLIILNCYLLQKRKT